MTQQLKNEKKKPCQLYISILVRK